MTVRFIEGTREAFDAEIQALRAELAEAEAEAAPYVEPTAALDDQIRYGSTAPAPRRVARWLALQRIVDRPRQLRTELAALERKRAAIHTDPIPET